jgi:pyruvate/2-oxoglutarate dehydrogenase complex dihydrolipoamide acyltransferase (E2) component
VDITTQVLGKVKKVYVSTNQEVKKGDTLFVLDREPYVQEIKSLEAKLSNMKATVSSYNTDISASRKTLRVYSLSWILPIKEWPSIRNWWKRAANKFDLEQQPPTFVTCNPESVLPSLSNSLWKQNPMPLMVEKIRRFLKSRRNLIRQSGIFPKRLFWLLQTVLFLTYSSMKVLLWLLLNLPLF